MPRKRREGATEQRLRAGAPVMKTIQGGEVLWTYLESGKSARADIVERLIREGVLSPRNDGLFGESQTYGAA